MLYFCIRNGNIESYLKSFVGLYYKIEICILKNKMARSSIG